MADERPKPEPTYFELSLPPVWPSARALRERVRDTLAARPRLQLAAAMTASELLENAIKYGEVVPAAPELVFSLDVDRCVVIRVSNGCTVPGRIRELEARIRSIEAAPDKEALYMGRLQELIDDPKESGKLGLYRIAFEGRFALACTEENQVVTVIARRDA